MKKSIYYLISVAIFAVVAISSCDLIDELLEIDFNTDFKEIHFTIEPSDADVYTFFESNIMSDLAEEISDNGGSIDNLRKVTLDSSYIEVEPFDNGNLDALAWGEVYIKAPPDYPELVLVASVYGIPEGVRSIRFAIAGEDVRNMLQQDQYTIIMKGELDKEVVIALNLILNLRYNVEVGG